MLADAGQDSGVINFLADRPFGGKASATPFDSDNIVVPVTTIDVEARARGLEAPYLIKLDTHGFEDPILKGAEETLRATEVIVIECYNFKISPECLLFYEMCARLQALGFRSVDLVDPLYRPVDRVFWQIDLVFVRSDRPEFRFANYK